MEFIKPRVALKMGVVDKNSLDKYISVIKKFTSGEMKASDFERIYLEMFKSETELNGQLFEILNMLFSDVDAFCGNPEIANYNKADPFHDIDENELLDRAKTSLKKLYKINKPS